MKILLGLSGGVDSSVAAYLLKKEKYNVIAGFMLNWDKTLNNDFLGSNKKLINGCQSTEDYNDAKEIAKILNIKLFKKNYVSEYWDKVFKDFIKKYKKGLTPNPDILCNKYIKFKEFLEFGINELNIDKIATGHYAKNIFNDKTNEYELYKPLDKNKDQTYFLSFLNQKQLSYVLFPLENILKEDVRKIALKQKLITYNKKDSTGICFIGERNFDLFLENYLEKKEGDIVNIINNKVIGKHKGCYFYTLGQRKNIGLNGMPEPYFVAKKDLKNNILYVAPKSKQSLLLTNKTIVKDFNWINSNIKNRIHLMKDIKVKFRYRQKDIKCNISIDEKDNLIIHHDFSRSITSGQVAVLYKGDWCLGGGIIYSTSKING